MSVFSNIVLNNIKREKKIFSKFACMNHKGIRKTPLLEKVPDRQNIRPIFFHDTDRIIHSQAYARYIDKTQVFYLFENDHITHRVLHVQFVSKIGRVIGRCLRLNEDLIEAIALGHDIGHVPYGHDGERFLNEICAENSIGYFCHNAQSVKMLMEIENKGELNLSLQVLDGILSHNGELLEKEYSPISQKSWDDFYDEYEKCFTVKDYSKKIRPMTLEGCVVRISDVIAYIGRDLEDAIALNLIKREDIPEEVASILGNSNDKIINTLAMNIIENSYDKPYLSFSNDVYSALKKLYDYSIHEIYQNEKIRSQNETIRNMFRMLYEVYQKDFDDQQSEMYNLFISNVSESYLLKYSKNRIVIDYISGMTDDFFNNQFKTLFYPRGFGYSL